MTGPGVPRHYGEELQDLLDGRLAEPHRSEIEAHLAGCARCRRELDALRWVKGEMRQHVTAVEAPAELVSRVRAELHAASRTRGGGSRSIGRRTWIAGAVAAALAAAAVIVVFARGRESPLPALVTADFVAYDTRATRLAFESGDTKAVEAYFARNGVAFPTHVYDLGMMSYRLAGGSVTRLGGRTSALFAYEGPDDTSLVCQMYEGTVAELPATNDVRQHNGFTFHVYRSGNVTMVFWQEDGVVCVLASDAPMEAVVQLAFAKAMRVE